MIGAANAFIELILTIACVVLADTINIVVDLLQCVFPLILDLCLALLCGCWFENVIYGHVALFKSGGLSSLHNISTII